MSLTIGSGGSGGVFAPTVTMGALLGGIVGLSLASLFPQLGVVPASFVVVGMAAVFSGAARTPISTLIMVAEMTGGYGLIVPAMLANISSFIVQRSLTHGRRYPTLYQAQVPTREDSPAHRGVFVRRALEMIEGGKVDTHRADPAEARHPPQVRESSSGDRRGRHLVAVRIAKGSPLEGKTVKEAFGSLAGNYRGRDPPWAGDDRPGGATQLCAADQIIAMATSETYQKLREQAGETLPS